MKIALYPGTFDPVTNGHISLIRRGCQIFDKIIVGVAKSTPKHTLFSLDERVALVRGVFSGEEKVEATPFDGMTVDFAIEKEACAILRGLRAVSDFDYEFQLALMNRRLMSSVETVFMMTDYKWLYISSTIIKAVASQGGDIKGLVPDNVLAALEEKYGDNQANI